MHIALAVDANYFEHAQVAIQSIMVHNPLAAPTFWLAVDASVTSEMRQQLESSLAGRAGLEFVSPPGTSQTFGLSRDPKAAHVSEAMYYRLALPHLIPEHINKILYVDADVLCTSVGLEEIFHMDLRGNVLAAVRDAFTRRLIDHDGLPLLRKLGLDPQAPYFNSGVLMIDPHLWRDQEITEKAKAYLRDSVHARRFPDQDALNAVCANRWLRLNKRWNHMMAWRLEADRGGSLSDAVLIHSAGRMKHWDTDFPLGRRRDLYERMLRDVREGENNA